MRDSLAITTYELMKKLIRNDSSKVWHALQLSALLPGQCHKAGQPLRHDEWR